VDRGGIFKLQWSPKIDFKELIPPAYGSGGPVREPYSYLVLGLHKLFENSITDKTFRGEGGIKKRMNFIKEGIEK